MRVLHLPYNTGSKIVIAVKAERKLGLDARGIIINNLDEVDNTVITINPKDIPNGNPLKFIKVIQAYFIVFREIFKADIVHWYYDYYVLKSGLILKWIKFLNKPAVVEFLGSDIRIPEVLALHNSVYKESYTHEYSYKFESLSHSREVQQHFKQSGFFAMVRPELQEFIQADIFPKYYKINNRIRIEDYRPSYPETNNKTPLIVHPVTDRGAKGTNYILQAIEELQHNYTFKFKVLENITHKETLAQMQQADIVIDQLILGAFGTTTIEAMALGKPVVCHISDNLRESLPPEPPIINATPDTIMKVLETLLQNSDLNRLGMQSRLYVEQYHDADRIAQDLKSIYIEVINSKK